MSRWLTAVIAATATLIAGFSTAQASEPSRPSEAVHAYRDLCKRPNLTVRNNTGNHCFTRDHSPYKVYIDQVSIVCLYKLAFGYFRWHPNPGEPGHLEKLDLFKGRACKSFRHIPGNTTVTWINLG
ncbi:hypothetical protein GCM10009565_37120 [Amycolatopsis albidoflavus]